MNRGEGTLLTAYFSLPHSAEPRRVFVPNWNSTVGDRQRAAGPPVLDDLMVFALLHID